jgi:hypothetical protein
MAGLGHDGALGDAGRGGGGGQTGAQRMAGQIPGSLSSSSTTNLVSDRMVTSQAHGATGLSFSTKPGRISGAACREA